MKLNNLPDSYIKHLINREPKIATALDNAQIDAKLAAFSLDKLVDNNPVVCLPIPDGFGSVKDELAEAYKGYDNRWENVADFVQLNLNTTPESWYCPTGWSVWSEGVWQRIPEPPAGIMVLDFETVEVSEGIWHPVCCVCLSAAGWYVWRVDFSIILETSVIPFGKDNDIVGYNVSYDRSYLDVEYRLKKSGNNFYDLMSMWIATNGMSNQQRILYKKSEADEEAKGDNLSSPAWVKRTGTNGLAAVYKFYTNKELDKGVRDGIVDLGLEWVTQNMSDVIRYCALDVLATLEVASYLFPAYKVARPSLVNRLGSVALGSCWVPLDVNRFPGYYDRVEAVYRKQKTSVNDLLLKACDLYLERGEVSTDGLDWTPAKTGKRKGQAKWYRDALTQHAKGNLAPGQRVSTTVLGLTWLGSPVLWDENVGGWCTKEHGVIPHPTRRGQPVKSMFLKDFQGLHENGCIGSPSYVREIILNIVSAINWVSSRKRIQSIRTQSPDGFPVCIPQMSVNGTVTGRATDPIWQVAANPKATRIGTELKSLVSPPSGYVFIGADVDSQESWLAGLHGDQAMGFNASTPLGAMNAMGSSKTKTDIHSTVARETGYSRDATKARVYGCVPLTTEALTKKGWKTYKDLKIGDLILAHNAVSGVNEWTEIEALTYHEDAELIKVSNDHNYEHVSTPDHRWYTKQRHRYNRGELVEVIRTTATIRKESLITTSAYSEGGNSPITPDEAAIIAWLITDGSVFWNKKTMKTSSSFGTKRGVQATVVQKKEMQVSLLYSLLEPYLTSVGHRTDSDCYTFRLKPQLVRELWVKAGLEPENENYVELVNNLTQAARKAFLEAFWLAEGHTDAKGVKHITQNIGSELESAIVAATLEGYGTRLVWKDGDLKCRSMRMIERKHVTGQRLIKTVVPNAPVWCPTTKFGTWVMRQGDTVTITGNCLYGQGIKGDSDGLLKNDPSMTEAKAKADSTKFIKLFKGVKDYESGVYQGGIASASFTRMEYIAESKQPRTPLTGAYMSKALAGCGDFKPTRVNWVVQSSGVDFRDMLVLLVNHFYRKMSVDGRLVLTIHDEIRTCVKVEHITQAIYALQLAHLYVRAAFILAHQLDNIPAGIAWFSAVDVDSVCLRKDPSDPQVTPTQAALLLGYTVNPQQLLELLNEN